MATAAECRVTSIAAWDGSPHDTPPMRWSEQGAAAAPRQTLVSVEVSGPHGTSAGVAGLTYYAHPAELPPESRLEPALSAWLGAAAQGVPRHGTKTVNRYEPRADAVDAPVELAVLDALGRATGLPAAAFMGGVCRTQLAAYASLPSFPTPAEAVECAADAIEAGFGTVKFHAAGDVDVDLATIGEARRRLGPPIDLIWDASRAYDLYSAVLVADALAEADFLWFEAPLDDDSTAALASLARHTRVPLVPDGMEQRSASEWAHGVSDGIWGALRLDVTRAAGVAAALRLLRLAEALGAPCEIQSYGFPVSQYSNLQLMLTTQACRFFEAPFPAGNLADDLASAPPLVEGFVRSPARPGLGHDIDVEILTERCTVLARASL